MDSFVKWSGWVFGVLGFIVSVWAYFETRQNGVVSYTAVSRLIFEQPPDFATRLIFPEAGFESDTRVQQTIVTIWNSGNISVRETDVRVPLRITVNSSAPVISTKIAGVRSAVPQNFSISDQDPKGLSVKWRIFDPGMAVHIAVLHGGHEEGVGLSGSLGPTITVKKFVAGVNSSVIFLVVGIAFGLLGALFIITLLNRLNNKYGNSNPPTRKREAMLIGALLGLFLVVSYTGLHVTRLVVAFVEVKPPPSPR